MVPRRGNVRSIRGTGQFATKPNLARVDVAIVTRGKTFDDAVDAHRDPTRCTQEILESLPSTKAVNRLAASGVVEVRKTPYAVASERQALDEVRRAAMLDAREPARIYAEAADLTQVEITEITDGEASPPDGYADMPPSRVAHLLRRRDDPLADRAALTRLPKRREARAPVRSAGFSIFSAGRAVQRGARSSQPIARPSRLPPPPAGRCWRLPSARWPPWGRPWPWPCGRP